MSPKQLSLTCALLLLLTACSQGEATPTPTLEATAESTATAAPTVEATAEATEVPPTPEPTIVVPTSAGSDCRPAEQITVAHAGQELCVTGVLKSVRRTEEATYLNFQGTTTFYWLTYDIPSIPVEAGDCVQMTKQVELLLGNPVMVVRWTDALLECGTGRNLLNAP